MLSYQHIYHAGCLADVHKHASLAVVLSKLTEKDKPLSYIETHAGRGVYNLEAPEARKTGEAREGVISFLNQGKMPENHPYVSLLHKMTREVGKNVYPGSPFIAEALLRPTDTLHLMELHPQEYRALRSFLHYPNTHIHHRDGYEGALALCPPSPRRGIVFIDPSYEIKTEYEKTAATLLKLHKKWPEGVLMVWYPVLKAGHHTELVSMLKDAGLPKFRHSEIALPLDRDGFGMKGSGLITVNTPFGTEEELSAVDGWF
ncbi:MAG: 23S rRNA (adenine(2030)-N(6))-methyltransferase RlmJ [Alphaproteobacteria bacterium]|jgi:23S rRNA (adenine2030-N6)-methyltransferase